MQLSRCAGTARRLSRTTVAAWTVALLLGAAGTALAKPRTIAIRGGRVTIDGPIGYEKVMIERKGKPPAESTCDKRAGTFDELFDLFKRLQAAVKTGKAAAVTPLLHFPFKVNGSAPRKFADAAELTSHFAEVFTPSVRKRIADAEPAALYCAGGGAMLGDGVVWGSRNDDGVVGADVVDP